MSAQLVALLDKYEVMPSSRVIWWDKTSTYNAKKVYMVGEMGRVACPHGRRECWDMLRTERCR